jgi:2-keto-4-pentenoate hydratase/2-oxohepta-3-ene-1,7-dioic acid hydratase in catechol pathway
MKLATFTQDNRECIGVVDEAGRIVDLHRAYALYLREVEGTSQNEELAAVLLSRDMCDFLKRYPVAFLKLPGTVIGPDDDIPYPPETQKLDYEVELAVIIGKSCVNVTKEQALDYVAGYAAFNDISARDVIRKENEVGIHLMGKSFPGFAPMGPYLVTADEISDPQNLKLWLRVNGELRQDSNLSYMIFKIRDMIAYWSQMGLNPGDVLTTGTPRGVAAGRKEGQTPWWLKPGDVVEAEVEQVGRLCNRIVSE